MAALEGGAAHNNWSFPAGNPPLNKLPSNDDRKLEHQQWQTASFLKEQCHPHEKRLRWSDCEEAGAECVHPSEFFTPSLDISPSAAPVHGCKGGITATTRPFSVVCGESQHQFPPRCMAMAELAGDRASSTSPETLPIHDKAEQFFLPLQHAIGSLPDTHTHGSSISFGAPRLEPYREFAHYDAWENARLKAEIVSHPLYEQLLAAHVACLRVATPVEHLGSIDVQLRSSHNLAARYSMLGRNVSLGVDEKEELDHFMASYLLLLQSFKDQLQEHVRVHAMEAIVGCLELRQALVRLTGVSLGEPSGATMSDDETEASFDTEFSQFDPMFVAGHDGLGFGPLIPTETERTLMERVRQELKIELKQGYRSRIADVREEILRKRRAGKLPSDTTFALKNWWKTHSKWPYPTEDEKAKLVQETGLELKQINNWFINQRKRNWHNNNSSSPSLPKSDVGSAGQSSNISLSLNSESLRPPSPLQ